MRAKLRLWGAPPYLTDQEEEIEAWLELVARHYGGRLQRISYQFLDKQEIQDINARFLQHDYPTDVVTFDYSKERQVVAEVYCGLTVIEDNAKRYGQSIRDEVFRVLAHGLLHCLGFDDQSAENKEEMGRAEQKCLNLRPKNLKKS